MEIAQKRSAYIQHALLFCVKKSSPGWMGGWMDEWIDGWMDGWVGVKAGLRIAYSN